jgi:hypothetical protein
MKVSVNRNIACFCRSRNPASGMTDELVNIRVAGEIGHSEGADSEGFL